MATQDVSQDPIFAGIQQTISRQFGVNLADIKRETPLEELDIDSLDRVDLAIQLEKQFATSLDAQQVRHCETIEDLVDFVRAATPNEQEK